MKVFDTEEIRDTDPHESEVYQNTTLAHAREGRILSVKKTIVYKNDLNQVCSLQVQGSVDGAFTDPIAIGVAISAAASMSAPLYETAFDYFPFLRIVATCSVQPASGSLDAWILP